MASPRPQSLRQLLAVLALTLVMPMLALALAVGVLQVRDARLRLEAAARADARAVLHRVDSHLSDRVALLRRGAAEARTDDIPGSIAALHRATGLHLAWIDADGTPLGDSRPPDSPLPEAARSTALRLLAEGRLVSPLVEDPASGGHALLITEPLGDGLLVLALPAEEFHGLLTVSGASRFDATRFPSLLDQAGRIVARWQDHATYVGRAVPAAARATLRADPEGGWHGPNLAGVPAAFVHVTSALSDLSVGVGITETAMRRPYWRSALVLGPAAIIILTLATAATLLMARRIGEPMAKLRAAAAALAEGRPPPRLETPVAEVNAVADAMADAAERRRVAEMQRDLLVRELHHRVKNLLTTAQSLAALSARTAQDPREFAAQFGDRLRALARTHTMLLEEPGGEVDLTALLTEVLAPYRLGVGRIALLGPQVRVPDEAAVPLGMVLHELATNALKYGALSLPEGRLRVSWRVEEASPPRLRLEWTETGGPPIASLPSRKGFGSQLLHRALSSLPENDVQTEWRPEGLTVRLSLGLRPPAHPIS